MLPGPCGFVMCGAITDKVKCTRLYCTNEVKHVIFSITPGEMHWHACPEHLEVLSGAFKTGAGYQAEPIVHNI